MYETTRLTERGRSLMTQRSYNANCMQFLVYGKFRSPGIIISGSDFRQTFIPNHKFIQQQRIINSAATSNKFLLVRSGQFFRIVPTRKCNLRSTLETRDQAIQRIPIGKIYNQLSTIRSHRFDRYLNRQQIRQFLFQPCDVT